MQHRGDAIGALKRAIANPPITKSEEIKTMTADIVNDAIQAVPADASDKVIAELNNDQKAILMSYVYKCMANSNKDKCSVLLRWHAKLVAVGGSGIIMRAMVNRTI